MLSDSNLSKELDIRLGFEESRKVLQDCVIRGLVPQEEAQMLESQEWPLEAQEEEAQIGEAQAEYVEQTGEGVDEKNTHVSSRICKKPAWMVDFIWIGESSAKGSPWKEDLENCYAIRPFWIFLYIFFFSCLSYYGEI